MVAADCESENIAPETHDGFNIAVFSGGLVSEVRLTFGSLSRRSLSLNKTRLADRQLSMPF